MSGADSDREMLVRIDERVNAFGRQLETINTTFQAQMATKPEVAMVAARVARLEWLVNLVLGAVVLAIVGAVMTLVLKGGSL